MRSKEGCIQGNIETDILTSVWLCTFIYCTPIPDRITSVTRHSAETKTATCTSRRQKTWFHIILTGVQLCVGSISFALVLNTRPTLREGEQKPLFSLSWVLIFGGLAEPLPSALLGAQILRLAGYFKNWMLGHIPANAVSHGGCMEASRQDTDGKRGVGQNVGKVIRES